MIGSLLARREMSSSLGATELKAWCGWLGWWYVRVWYVRVLHRGSRCAIARAMDGHIMRCGIISSCKAVSCDFQDCKSAAGRELCKPRYSKYSTFTLTFAFGSDKRASGNGASDDLDTKACRSEQYIIQGITD